MKKITYTHAKIGLKMMHKRGNMYRGRDAFSEKSKGHRAILKKIQRDASANGEVMPQTNTT